ncbi:MULTISPECIES: hypothetical protein [Helicobacter]|uniref:Sua5 YciO YrdC YwlC family protein n=1 Tax=Helicobacter ibis TaxID=2962633 RepID=A0ABT4VFH0_9HELI|nr:MULTISPECIES: hypothetical protein [Helicobacter]MDA3967730.1 hypothetical protein [Helicobacter sp. WB40]MDA3969450.1 hypothetical protein [Helicobacter ibis]
MYPILLAQSDTTAGFLSKDPSLLNKVKNRSINQKIIITTSKLSNLKSLARIPNIHKNKVRRQTQSTFIYKNNKAIRVIKDSKHSKLLDNFDYLYSTSANPHKQNFETTFAINSADIVILDERGLYEGKPSQIYKLNNKTIKRLR